MILTKCGKINDVQATRSTVTAVLKKAVLIVRKESCPSCQEKLFALGSGCFQAAGKVISTFTLWILAENGKISLKGISLFLV